ncbi:MAG: ABC transporter ATP-binding protein [uncultured Sulfurovum sp.]|uniref:ABC transporter ATP-binding protein n=1 Tax=uncultured Sulfurovum sp. TaxID=269237 RepID=A0A6S6TWE4_9BACT|nr:MAG: ABC transporter ATP-binding protein [uncultured Sulfurovum sp.]
MIDLIVLKERQEEIEQYIQNDDLDMATKRSMDFVTDFSSDKSKRRESIDIRATYSSLRKESRQLGRTAEMEERFRRLRGQILEFIDDITDEFDAEDSIEKKSSVKSETVDNTKQESSKKQVETLTSYEKEKKRFKENRNREEVVICDDVSDIEQETVFSARGIRKVYKSNSINFSFKPIDLDLKYGEITALVGENGNGKSTLLNMISGELLQSSGTLSYPSLKGDKQKDWYQLKTQIAYIHQELPKWQGLLRDNLHFTLGINGIKNRDNIDEVDFIIHRLGLEKYTNAKWDEISGGFKLRFSLARSILRNPKLLILDEPLANLDIHTQNLFLTDLRDLTNSLKNKMSVVISSQNLYEVEAVADNIVFMSDGKATYNGTVKDFGEDREENSYEVKIAISEDELLSVMESVEYINIKKNGANYIIDTTRSVTSKILLELFLAKRLEVKYFRDISKSTRKLFGEIK